MLKNLFRLGVRQGATIAAVAVLIVAVAPTARAQPQPATAAQRKTLPQQVERALEESNRASVTQLNDLERRWRDMFRKTRDPERLKDFIDEALDIFEKIQHLQELATGVTGPEARTAKLFRERILNEDTLCTSLEKSINEFAKALDEQDQALLIKLKIDRPATRKSLTGTLVDPASIKRPINVAMSATVSAVQEDMVRTVAAFAASEAIGAGVKQAARDAGVMPGEPGSLADLLTGFLIDIGVSLAVDAVTDPTPGMVEDLNDQLLSAEKTILDGTPWQRGLIPSLKRVVLERSDARRKLLEAEFGK